MRKNLFFIFALLFALNLPAFSTQMPSDLYDYIKQNLKGAKQRFDSVIMLPDGVMYVPLYPAKKEKVEKIEITYTYPESLKKLNQRPEVVIFNNNFVLLKVFKDKSGNYTITKNDQLPVKVKLGVMPQDMLVPPGLMIPENLRLILGDLVVPSPEEVSLKVPQNEDKPIRYAPIAELKNKKIYAISPASNYLLAIDSTSSTGLYELKLNAAPLKILSSSSLGYTALIYYNQKFIDILDLKNERIIAQIQTEAPLEDMSMDSENNIVYLSAPSINTIYVVDLNALKLVRKIKVTTNPEKLFSSADGKSLVYSDKYSGDFFLLNLAGEYVSSFVVNAPNTFCAFLKDEDLYTLSRAHSYLSKIDPFAKLLKGEIEVGKKPTDMLYYNDKIFILSAQEGLVSIFDITQGKIVKIVKIDNKGFYTKITRVPNGKYAVITGYNDAKLIVMDLDKMSVVQKRPSKADISGIVILDTSNEL